MAAATAREGQCRPVKPSPMKLRNVPVKDVVLFPARRAERTYSAAKQQCSADGNQDSGQVRLELGEPVSDDGEIGSQHRTLRLVDIERKSLILVCCQYKNNLACYLTASLQKGKGAHSIRADESNVPTSRLGSLSSRGT